jgi:stage III sporulation protein AB
LDRGDAVQLAGALFIVLACGLMGLTIARSFVCQVQNIKDLITMLQLLETEIEQSRSALPIALQRVGRMGGLVEGFARTVLSSLADVPGEPFLQAWSAGLDYLRSAGVSKDLAEDLAVLGAVLGNSGVEDQKRHLRLARIRLEEFYDAAVEEKRLNFRLWSYLGFGTGLLIILLII